ncbi:MAG TPA: LuxR C-terminal-related transcriptional regulator [Anaerolineales bacterium]|jgi:LuxR family maltose regulon positive regulatory protein|nr:LuxR C-terminal-related transcriptional regulator [Anaerolineales bacterium]
MLRTKLFVPHIRPKHLARPGLIEKISGGLDKSLILISTPAGFGKTTILAEWAAQADLRVAWLSLDGGDNDPNRFLRYVIAALNNAFAKTEAGICATAQAMLQSVQPLPLQTILVALINDLTDLSEPFALVLDDYQFITSPAVNETMTFILEHLPRQMHLVIASRVDPFLPLHRLRASQRLLEIRTDELRFTEDEIDVFMNKVLELTLSKKDISILSERTEGWIAGLQMAALSMQGIADRSAFVRALSGSHRYILEYLIEEVLNRQTENIQSFLLQTSVLNRLCGPLCDALLEEREDSQSILEHLERSNLFLTPLDEVNCWYRYHHLFGDLLRARLQRAHPERVPGLHLRASRWYEESGLPEEAIQHALAAKELERAARLVEQFALNIMSRGEMASLLRLFEALPEDPALRRPTLDVFYAWALTFSGQFDKAEPQLHEIEKQVQPDEPTREVKEILGSIAIIRGLIADYKGDMASAVELARQADELLPEDKWAERSIISFVMGDGYSATGELDKAEQAFEKIFQAGRKADNPWTVSVALHKLALLKKLQGKMRSVEALYREAIQFASERGGQRYGSMGAAYVGWSDVLRERNELEAAQRMVSQAIEDMERWQNPTDLVNGYVTLARIGLAQGNIDLAGTATEKAEEASRLGEIFPITRLALEACQVRLWLANGDLPKANQWLKEKQLDERPCIPDQRLDFVSELEWISLARVLTAKGEPDGALDLLSHLAEEAETGGRTGRLIEILVLVALASAKSGKREKAVSILKRSLALAEPEGYVRTFLDEGEAMKELLRACSRKTEGSLKAYIDRLLKAFLTAPIEKTVISASPSRPEPLIESLTEREMEVLHLLSAGLSNREIAERLYLSEGTVKTHTHNLYGKLGVQSRTGAIARAKELDII